MGEAADLLLEGFLCERCFEVIDGEGVGYARLCPSCLGSAEDEDCEAQ